MPPLSGYFSKDQILAFADRTGDTFAWGISLVAAFFSALYMGRLIFLTFLGRYRGDEHPHEAPPSMTLPLALLAVGAVGAGVLGLSAGHGALATFLAPVLGPVPEGTQGLSESSLSVISVVVALGGLAVAYLVYLSGRVDWLALRQSGGEMHRTLEAGWYVDSTYARAVEIPGKATAQILAFFVDAKVIDGAVNGIGVVARRFAAVARRVQTGLVRTYALGFLIGAVAILVYVGVRL